MSLSEVSQSQNAPDLARELGQAGLSSILTLMCKAYVDLLNSRFVHKSTSEDEITEEWFVKIQYLYKDSNLSIIPVHQKQDLIKGRPGKRSPTIDFCFRDRFFSESYFGTECKLLDEGNKKHATAYVSNNGIGRFLDGRYSSKSSAGAMVGYVRVGNPEKVAKEMAKRISLLSDKRYMRKKRMVKNFKHIYESRHKRTSGVSPFQIYHLFCGFNV